MSRVYYVTHPDVVVDPAVPVPRWPLSEVGRARMRALCEAEWVGALGSIWCSTEQKALDGAEILSAATGLGYTALEALGENDRSSTGFMPPAEFWALVERFFAEPEKSVEGWETAAHAQARIAAAVDELIRRAPPGDAVVIAHGGVGNLLLSHLKGVPISREQEQPLRGPEPGTVGGCWFAFDAETRALVHDWNEIHA
jgi:broad specificity phosphatase PhoE